METLNDFLKELNKRIDENYKLAIENYRLSVENSKLVKELIKRNNKLLLIYQFRSLNFYHKLGLTAKKYNSNNVNSYKYYNSIYTPQQAKK